MGQGKSVSTILIIPFVFISIGYSNAFGAVDKKMVDFVICKNRKIVRTIRVEKDAQSSRCETKYTKSGKDRTVGNGQRVTSCQRILKNIKSNLQQASWTCREVSKATVYSEKKEKNQSEQ